jgi:hypothetical protein
MSRSGKYSAATGYGGAVGYKGIAQHATGVFIPKLQRSLARSRAEARRLRIRLDAAEAALERLGSSEGMTRTFFIDKDTQWGEEIVARIDYARKARS